MAWPDRKPPPAAGRHPGVQFDPADPLYAQMGVDARRASAEDGAAAIAGVEDHLVQKVQAFLAAS